MGRGNLKIDCDWSRKPQVAVKRDGLVVATAELDVGLGGLMDAKEVGPMAPEEWQAAKQLALAWIAEHPKPAA